MQTHTLQTPPAGRCLAAVSAAPCFLCSRHPQRGWAEGVLLWWWVNSCVRLPRACCPSNCCVVRRRVPLKALSDSSKSLASNSDVDPLSTNNSPPALRHSCKRFSACIYVCVHKPGGRLCHRGWSTCLGRGARGQGR